MGLLRGDQSQIYAANLIDGAKEHTLILDSDLRIQAASPSFFRTFHLRPDEVRNHPLIEVSGGQWNVPALVSALEGTREEDLSIVATGFEVEVPGVGRKRFRLTVNPARSGGQKLLVLWFEDVAGQDRLEGSLRDQAAILDLLHDSVILRDMNSRIRFWNRASEALLGWKSSDAFGKISHELLQTVFPKAREKLEVALLKTGSWEGELVHRTRDGSHMTVQSRWAVLREKDRPVAVVEVNRALKTGRSHAASG
jgi:PAS domain S-box-containing protein